MSDEKSPEPGGDMTGATSIHRLSLRNPDSVSDPRAWGLSSDERRLHMGRVISGTLKSGDGNVFGDNHDVKMTNRLRSASSVADHRAWSLDPHHRRSFMADTIRRTPPHSTTDLRHAELLAQLRENNLPEFVERLLTEKNQQIEDLEHNVRSLSRIQHNSDPASAGESAGRLEVLDSSLLGATDLSPEVLRHAATTNASNPGDLSRPDISLMAPDKQQEVSPESAAGGRPGSPASERSFGSARTVAASEADARSSRNSAGSRATSAHTTSSGDSIQHLRAALARKKQLLHNRKQQLERTRPSPVAAPPSPPDPPPPPPAEITQVAELSTAEDAAAEQARHQLQQVQARLRVLDPIMAQLDADYSGLRDSLAQLKQQQQQQPAASDTELALASQLEEARITIRQQEALQQQLQQHLQQLQQQGVPTTDALLRSVEEQLLTTLRDMELLKLDACGKMHEATALLARHQRHSQHELLARLRLAEEEVQHRESEAAALRSEVSALDAGRAEQTARLQNLLQRLTDAEAAARLMRTQVDAAGQQAAEAKQRARGLESRLIESEQQVRQLQNSAEGKEEQVRQLQHSAEEKEQQLQELQHSAEEKECQLQQLQHSAEEREQQLQQLQHSTEEKECQLQQLQHSADQREELVQQLEIRLRCAEEDGLHKDKSVEEAMAQLRAAEEAALEKDASVQELTAKISGLDQELRNRSERVAELTARVEFLETELRGKERQVQELVSRLEEAAAAVNGSHGRGADRPDSDAGAAGDCVEPAAAWRERARTLQDRCCHLAADRDRELKRRRKLEERLTALLVPLSPPSDQGDRAARRLRKLLDKVHRQGVEMLTLSELRFVRSHSPVGRGPLAAEPAPESEPEHPPLVEQQLREQVELLEWRLREERALVDELQSCLQRQHQTKLQLIGRLCDVVADPAARASQAPAETGESRLDGAGDQLPPQPYGRVQADENRLRAADGSDPRPADDGDRRRADENGVKLTDELQQLRATRIADEATMVEVRQRLSDEQHRCRLLEAALESERAGAAQLNVVTERRRAQLQRLQAQLGQQQTGTQQLRTRLVERTAECGRLRVRLTEASARPAPPPQVTQRATQTGPRPGQMSGVSDIEGEVERLRGRIGELEQQLGSRGDAPSSGGGQWRDRLEQERSGWSQERQRLQQRIARLEQEQERQHRLGASGGDGDDARLKEERGRYLRAESYRRALCWQKRYLMVLLGGYQETEVMTLERMTQLTGGAFQSDGRRFLCPLRKFRAAAWAVVAVHRMGFMVHRWQSGRRLAAPATEGREPAAAEAQVRPSTPTSCASDGSQLASAELGVLDRLVWECSSSTPDLSCQLETRSVASVSDICSEDLQPYLARFDALLGRQGLPPQGGAARR